MISRDQVEKVLKINGVAPLSPDEEIRSVLLSARFNKDEVDTAIMVLRENKNTNSSRVDGLHKVFRTNEALKPEEISALLGIDIDVSNVVSSADRRRDFSLTQKMIIWVLTLLLAIVGLVLYMYVYHVGLFHPLVGIAAPKGY